VTLPTILTIVSTAIFFVAERLAPGRPLPPSSRWYLRALAVNFAQLGITLATGRACSEPSEMHRSSWIAAASTTKPSSASWTCSCSGT
jgi:hypothetical protein